MQTQDLQTRQHLSKITNKQLLMFLTASMHIALYNNYQYDKTVMILIEWQN